MFTTLTSKLYHAQIGIAKNPIKRTLFIGTPVKKKANYAVAGLTATFVTATMVAQDNENKKSEKLTYHQAESILHSHILNNKNEDLIEAAKTLNWYGAYAGDNKLFFRGESIPQHLLNQMENNLGTIVELKKNTSITTSETTAKKFSEKNMFDKVFDLLTDEIDFYPKNKKNDIIYDIKIPPNFKFIRIPNKATIITTNEFFNIYEFEEDEYVLPKETLIKITKSNAHQEKSEKLCYTIHVLSDAETAEYYAQQTDNKSEKSEQ